MNPEGNGRNLHFSSLENDIFHIIIWKGLTGILVKRESFRATKTCQWLTSIDKRRTRFFPIFKLNLFKLLIKLLSFEDRLDMSNGRNIVRFHLKILSLNISTLRFIIKNIEYNLQFLIKVQFLTKSKSLNYLKKKTVPLISPWSV